MQRSEAVLPFVVGDCLLEAASELLFVVVSGIFGAGHSIEVAPTDAVLGRVQEEAGQDSASQVLSVRHPG